MKAEIIKNDITVEDKEFFERVNPGYIVTGDCIKLSFKDRYGLDYEETLPIFKGDSSHKWTPYGMARQTGKYIVCARYDRYYKFTTEGEIVSLDAEDDSTNR